MKTTDCWLTMVAIGLLALVGCKKAEQAAGPSSEYYGVKVDVPKLDVEFTNPSQDLQDRLNLIIRFYRYEQFAQAVTELDALSKMPNLTESQKKLANELIEQTKQVIAKAPPHPGR
jgi:hypothetical protein